MPASRKQPVYSHLPGLKVGARFSDCRRFRYLLTLEPEGDGNGKTLCAILQNPSTADEKQADKSVQFLERLVFQRSCPEFEGVKRLCIVNQFAYIQTSGFNGGHDHIGPENDRYLIETLARSDSVLIAWGKSNRYTERKRFICDLLATRDPHSLWQTRAHPSRGRYRDFIVPYQRTDHLPD